MRGISWVAEKLLASQEGLCSMELVMEFIGFLLPHYFSFTSHLCLTSCLHQWINELNIKFYSGAGETDPSRTALEASVPHCACGLLFSKPPWSLRTIPPLFSVVVITVSITWSKFLYTLQLTEPSCPDFGNNGRNLLVRKFCSAVGMCEISGLAC
jgi:hypothetical protein